MGSQVQFQYLFILFIFNRKLIKYKFSRNKCIRQENELSLLLCDALKSFEAF